MNLEDQFYEPGSEDHPGSIKLATRAGSWISNEQWDEYHPQQLQIAKSVMENIHKGIIVRSLTARYNCHGMTFASRRTSIFDPAVVQMILEEDGYAKLEDRNDAERGDVFVFRRSPDHPILHSGIVFNYRLSPKTPDKKFEFLSQWGRNGEYFHDEECAKGVFGDVCEFYSDSRVLDKKVMPLGRIFDSIESFEFSAKINVASSVDHFLTVLVNDIDYQLLSKHLKTHSEHADYIVERIRYLADLEIDYSYANRYDAALSAYVLALSEDKNTAVLSLVGAELMTAAPNVWWSKKIADKIMSRISESAGSATTIDFVEGTPYATIVNLGVSEFGVVICGRLIDKLERPKFYRIIAGEPEQTFDPPNIILEPDPNTNARIYIN